MDNDRGNVHDLFGSSSAIGELRVALSKLQGGGSGPTSGGVSDDWKESVDRQLGQLHADVRALLNRGVAAVVALAVFIAGLYLYTNEKFDRLNERMSALQVEQARANAKLDAIIERLPAPKAD